MITRHLCLAVQVVRMQTALHNLDINKLNTLRARTRTLFFVTLGITKLIITQVCVHLNFVALNNKLHQIFCFFSVIMSKAFIQKPAPSFNAKAVLKGEFVDIKLSDYKGSFWFMYLFNSLLISLSVLFKTFACDILLGQYLVLFFYPLDL